VSSAESALRSPQPDLGTRLAAWLTLARVSNTPTVVSNVLAGAALAGIKEAHPSLGWLALAMVAFYTAGMLLNDICDYGWDLTHRPDRPLVVGLVSRPAAMAATGALLAVGAALLWQLGQASSVSGLVLIGCIVAYDVWHKTNPLSPLVMAACRVLVYVTAFAAFAWPPTPVLFVAGGLLVVYMVGLTAIAKSGRASSAIIAGLIAGISLFDAAVLIASGAGLAMIGIAVLAFGLTLLLQRWVEGT
jgi:4-hydroxybenzoate polyprenyltransferase